MISLRDDDSISENRENIDWLIETVSIAPHLKGGKSRHGYWLSQLESISVVSPDGQDNIFHSQVDHKLIGLWSTSRREPWNQNHIEAVILSSWTFEFLSFLSQEISEMCHPENLKA